MGLKIIGSGFGQTGTKSIKEALETLGFGPCHHMYEIVENLDQLPNWQAAVNGEQVDWEHIYDGYSSQVDWPGSHFWRQSMDAFPDAKVLHSVRPVDKWWASFEKTIGKLLAKYPAMDLPPPIRALLDMNHKFIGEQTFGGKFQNRDAVVAAFEKRTADVRALVPAEKLLVFDVADGWHPLCAFLEVPKPDVAFPHHNLRADFWEVLGGEPT